MLNWKFCCHSCSSWYCWKYKIGNYVTIGGQAGISGHLVIGDNVTMVIKWSNKNIKQFNNCRFPAKDIKLWKKEIIRNSLRK